MSIGCKGDHMDGMENENALMNGSSLERDNLTTNIDNELVTSQPISKVEKEVEHLREIDATLRVEEENTHAIEDLKVGGGENVEKEPVEEVGCEEQCQTNSTIENVNQGEIRGKEQAINKVKESFEVDDANTVTTLKGNEKDMLNSAIEDVNQGGEVRGKEQTIIEANESFEVDGEVTVTTHKGNEKVEHIGEIVLKHEEVKGQEVKVVNNGEERSEKEVTENEDDGEKRSENEPAMKSENDEDGTKKRKDKENTETIRMNAKKRNRRRKKKTTFATTVAKEEVVKKRRRGKKKIPLASANAKDVESVDQGETSCKNKDVDEACIGPEKEFWKNMDDGEPSGKKRKRPDNIVNSANKGEFSLKNDTKVGTIGMIFMCSSKTKSDCYQYKVFGLPAAKRDIVLKIYKGMRLFLFDIDLKLLYGIYKAAEPGGYNIEPKAFKSAFPSQVRFEVFKDCLPLAEENFKNVIKDNYYSKNKFNCQLSPDQVKSLCKLFEARGQVPNSQQIVRGPSKQINKGPNFRRIDKNPTAQISAERDRNRRKDKKPKNGENDRRMASVRETKPKNQEKHSAPVREMKHRNNEKPSASVHENSQKNRKRKDATFQDHMRKDRRLNGREQERQLVSVHDPLHYSRPVLHPPPLPRLSPPAMSYGYSSRPVQTEIYQRASYLEDHERERRAIDLPLRRRDEIHRIDPVYSHNERRPSDLELRHHGERERHVLYETYPDRPLYRDPLYSSGGQPELYSSGGQPEYYSFAGRRPPAEYHLSSTLPSESGHASGSLPSDYHQLYYRY